MPLKTTRWDASEHLNSDKAIACYLEAVFEDGDPGLIAASIGTIAKAKGMSQIAAISGLSREHLYRALSQDGNPELSTLTKVMRAIGMRILIEPAKKTRSRSKAFKKIAGGLEDAVAIVEGHADPKTHRVHTPKRTEVETSHRRKVPRSLRQA